jgi:hypothetical protein
MHASVRVSEAFFNSLWRTSIALFASGRARCRIGSSFLQRPVDAKDMRRRIAAIGHEMAGGLHPPRACAPGGLVCALACLCVLVFAGCDETGPSHASASPPPSGGSAADVIARSSSQLVAIRTSWAESRLLGGRGRRQIEGPGVILVTDSRRALVLTSRRLVDPPYDPQGPRSVREVSFQVYRPGQGPGGQFLYGRLVAVFMNTADLALLLIDAPSRQRSTMPMLQPSQLRTGDQVTLVGRPSDGSFLLSTGLVKRSWSDGRVGGQQFQVGVSAGALDTMGVVLHSSGRVAGLVCGRQGSLVTANSVGQITQQEFWEYLVDEAATRELLSTAR